MRVLALPEATSCAGVAAAFPAGVLVVVHLGEGMAQILAGVEAYADLAEEEEASVAHYQGVAVAATLLAAVRALVG